MEDRYDLETAAAWILGHARNTGIPDLPEEVRRRTADACSEEEKRRIIAAGQAAGLKLYPFKLGTQTLARTRKTLIAPIKIRLARPLLSKSFFMMFLITPF